LEQRKAVFQVNDVLAEIHTLMGQAHAYAKNSGLVEGPCQFPKYSVPRTPPPRERSLAHPRQFAKTDASAGQTEFFQAMPSRLPKSAPSSPARLSES
jgi:hypothetical protein